MAIILKAIHKEKEYSLSLNKNEKTIGRSSSCDLQIPDSQLSGKHCNICTSNNRALIKDLGTTNGTFLNHAKIEASHLYLGDSIIIGTTEMGLDDHSMNSIEKKAHSRDYSSTKLTFVNLKSGAVTDQHNLINIDKDKEKKQKEKIKKMNMKFQGTDIKLDIKKPKKKIQQNNSSTDEPQEKPSLFDKVKKLFNK